MAKKKPPKGGEKPSDKAKKSAKGKGAAKPPPSGAAGAKKKAATPKKAKKKPAATKPAGGPSAKPKGKPAAKAAESKTAAKSKKKPAKAKPAPKTGKTVKVPLPKAKKPEILISPGPGGLQPPDSMLPDGAAPELLPFDAGEEAVALIRIGGGSVIHGDGGMGTVTIACMDTSSGKNVLSVLTAAHVVDWQENKTVTTIGGDPIGTVTHVGGKGGTPIDVAAIKITDRKVHRDVQTANKTFPIQQFNLPVSKGDVVIHGGPHGKDGTVKGTVQLLDANAVIGLNTLSGEVAYQVFGLMKIAPAPAGVAFGEPGDSGSAVFKSNGAGKHDLVGVLVAVDNAGFGYAHHMADQPGGSLGVASLMGVRKLLTSEVA